MKQKTIATRHLRTKIAAGYVLILSINGYGKLLAFAYIALCIAGEHQKY